MDKKKLGIIIGLLLFTIANSSAQNLKFGFLGGYDIVSIHQPELTPRQIGPPYRNMSSYNFNAFISYKSKGVFGFSVEPGIMQKGGANGAQNICRTELTYFQLPCLLDGYVLKKLFFSGGLEFAYLLNAKASYPDRTEDINSGFENKFELSGLLGLNFIVTKRINLGIRYNHGLTYVLNQPNFDNRELISMIKLYNKYFRFAINYTIFQW